MSSPYAVLGELWWREDRDFTLVKIEYVSRGAPGDLGTATGRDVKHIEKTFFELGGGTVIPYHRVLRVEYAGETVFSRSG